MSEKEFPANAAAVLRKAVGNGNAAFLLQRIVYWNTRKKGGEMYQGRLWSFRSQREWIEQEAGLAERTGKRSWALLVAGDFIMTEVRVNGPKGNHRPMMHVALTDKTYALLDGAGVPHLQMPLIKAELALAEYAKAEQKAAPKKMSWADIMAEPKDDADAGDNLAP